MGKTTTRLNMKRLKQYINEALKINSKSKVIKTNENIIDILTTIISWFTPDDVDKIHKFFDELDIFEVCDINTMEMYLYDEGDFYAHGFASDNIQDCKALYNFEIPEHFFIEKRKMVYIYNEFFEDSADIEKITIHPKFLQIEVDMESGAICCKGKNEINVLILF